VFQSDAEVPQQQVQAEHVGTHALLPTRRRCPHR
jgi:hypothetical protein